MGKRELAEQLSDSVCPLLDKGSRELVDLDVEEEDWDVVADELSHAADVLGVPLTDIVRI